MKQPVIFIVGAGCGIGLGISMAFGKKGYKPVLITCNSDTLEEMKQILASQNIESDGVASYCGDQEGLKAALHTLEERFGTPDVLVYNASSHTPGLPSELDSVDLINDFKVNVIGALVAVQEMLPGMKQRGSGSILLTGGGQAVHPSAAIVSLGIGKSGLRSLALSLHEEVKSYGLYAGTLTVSGFVQPNTPFHPELIGEAFYKMHQNKKEAEVVVTP